MSFVNVKEAIMEALKDLEMEDFQEFCDRLVDPEKVPCIRVSEVEKKNRGKIVKLLISRCEERGAMERTVETLRMVGCNNEARILESKCKPQFKAENSPSTELDPGPSTSLLRDRTNTESKGPRNVKRTPPRATKLPKSSEVVLLFGKYEGQTVEWVLQNDVGWAVYVVATHQIEREDGDQSQTAKMKNKDALAEYVSHFPDVEEDVHFYKEGLAPVGFGKYEDMTRKDLYNSRDGEEKSYVDWLRSMEKTGKGVYMEAMVKYVLYRDRKACGSFRSGRQRSCTAKRAAPSSSQSAAKNQRL